MNHLDITPNLPNLNNRLIELVEKSKSLQEKRLIELCKNNVDFNDLNRICSVLNKDFKTELGKNNFDFNKAVLALNKPLGVS